MGTPVWSHLFNSSLEGNTRRAIDIHEGEKVDAGAFQLLAKAAVALNGPRAMKREPSSRPPHDRRRSRRRPREGCVAGSRSPPGSAKIAQAPPQEGKRHGRASRLARCLDAR
jgi:hypothetical protein